MTHKIDSIKINQDQYIHQVLVEFNIKDLKPASVFLNFSINLKDQIIKFLNIKDHKIFRYLINRLIFMTIDIQIDIAIAIN